MVYQSITRNICIGGLVVFISGCGGGGDTSIVTTIPESFKELKASDEFTWSPSVELPVTITINSPRDAVLTITAGTKEIYKGTVANGSTFNQSIMVAGTEDTLKFSLDAFGKTSEASYSVEDLENNPSVTLELQTVENYQAPTEQELASEGR